MKKQKFISKKWFILLGLVLLLVPLAVHATVGDTSAVTPTAQLTGTFDKVFKDLAGVLTQLMRAFQKLLWPIMLAIGGLLGNDLLFGAGMEQRLLEVWTQIRNLVNIAFVVMLLGVALYNVVGFGKQDNLLLKTVLPKIIIALIAVNFSYIAMKVVLDVTNVVTIAIFALPASIGDDIGKTEIVDTITTGTGASAKTTYEVKDLALEAKICKSMFGTPVDFTKRIKSIPPKKQKDAKEQMHCEIKGSALVFTEKGKQFFAQYSPRNASLILAIQLMNITDVDKITEASSKGFNLSSLSFTLLFSVIIYLLYAVAYAVLFIILIVRLVVLWIFIALSPLAAISIAFPDLLSKASSDFDIKDKFIKHAIAPIMVAIPMTIGYIMLTALKNIKSGQIRNDFQLGALDINTAGISDLQTMMVAFGAVAVIWTGAFAAAKDTYAAGIVDRFKSKLQDYGGTIVKALKLLPVIPAGAGAKGRISFKQVSQLWREPMNRLEAKYGGEDNKGRLTTYQVSKIRTAHAARQALGRKGLDNKEVQRALATKIQKWAKSPDSAKKRLHADVTGKIAKYGGWKKFKAGGLREKGLRELATLAGAAPRTPGRPGTGAKGTGPVTGGTVPAKTADILAYGEANNLNDAELQADYTKWAAENAKINPNKKTLAGLEEKMKKNKSFKHAANVRKSQGSLREVGNVSTKIGYSKNAGKITKDQLTDLETKIKAADKELETKSGFSGVNGGAERKKILKSYVKQALGAKYDSHIKNNAKAGNITKLIE